MADHFSSQELSVLVAQGARSLEGQRLLDHFGRGCQACWRLLTEFAATCEAAVEDHEEPAVAPDVRSLERCLAFLAPRPANAPPRAAHLRPIHRHVLAQTCGTTTDVTKALTFRRLVLEECRHQSLQASSAAIEQLRWAMASLPDDELARQAPERTLALRGLSWAYLADSYRFVGRGFEADAAFTMAREPEEAAPLDADLRGLAEDRPPSVERQARATAVAARAGPSVA